MFFGSILLEDDWLQHSFQTRVSGFDRIVQIDFFLNQNDIILVKKQKSTGCNQIFDRILPGQPSHTGFFHPLFFLQLGPVPAPDGPAGSDFKTMVYNRPRLGKFTLSFHCFFNYFYIFLIFHCQFRFSFPINIRLVSAPK